MRDFGRFRPLHWVQRDIFFDISSADTVLCEETFHTCVWSVYLDGPVICHFYPAADEYPVQRAGVHGSRAGNELCRDWGDTENSRCGGGKEGFRQMGQPLCQ